MTESLLSVRLARSIVTLLAEGLAGPEEGPTWFTDEKAGLLQVLRRLSHVTASTPPGPGRRTIAAHAEHLRYSLNLANRALQGENAYATADWSESWQQQSVDEAGWKRLLDELDREHRALADAIESGDTWLLSDDALTGTLAACVNNMHTLRYNQVSGWIWRKDRT